VAGPRPAGGRPRNPRVGVDVEIFARLAGAIVLETFALAVWNVGTRAPLAVLRDVSRAVNNARALAMGVLSLIVGLVFVAAATVLLLPAIGDVSADFVPVEIFTFLAALTIEYLIGNDLRGLIARLAGASRMGT
jgi:hypothetical protein